MYYEFIFGEVPFTDYGTFQINVTFGGTNHIWVIPPSGPGCGAQDLLVVKEPIHNFQHAVP